MAFCTKCGATPPSNAMFCSSCGTKISSTEEKPAPLAQGTAITAEQNTSEDDGKYWHYEENGKKLGPVSSAKIKELIKSGQTIHRFTHVWQNGMPDWKKAEDTELAQYFEGPPPLSGDAVNNTIVWILAFAPIIGGVLEAFLSGLFHTKSALLAFVTIALNIGLSILDEKKLNAAGHNTEALGLGSAWLVPVYLYKRAKALKHNMAYFIVWIVTILLWNYWAV